MSTTRLLTCEELIEQLIERVPEDLKALATNAIKRHDEERTEQGKREGDLYRRINELERKCADRETIIKALVAQEHLTVCRDEIKNRRMAAGAESE